MRLVSFGVPDTVAPRLGVVVGDEIVDLADGDPALAMDMTAFLALGAAGIDAARRVVAGAGRRVPLAGVRLRAPVPRPGKVFGIGLNFRSFLEAAQRRGMTAPAGQRVWFNRQANCVVGPTHDLWRPRASSALDFEGELAIVIGRRGRHVDTRRARELIAGFTICNDVTVRDWAARCPLLGKSFDTHAPMGPWIVTADEVGDPHDLTIETTVNGEVRQRGSTAEMLSGCDDLIAELSAITTLEPGDVVLTGTPDGCAVLDDAGRYLQVGDTVRVAIDGIGWIENAVVPEAEDAESKAADMS